MDNWLALAHQGYVLRSSGLKVRRAQVDFATSGMAEVFEYSKTDSRVVKVTMRLLWSRPKDRLLVEIRLLKHKT